MKAQIFSPVYTVIFAAVIVSVLVIYSSVITGWKEYNMLRIESDNLQTLANLVNYFTDYKASFNSSIALNITIDDYVNVSYKDYTFSFKNENNLPIAIFQDVKSLTIEKNEGVWLING